MSCRFLIRFWETETHAKTYDDCYVSTFRSRRDKNHENILECKKIRNLNVKKNDFETLKKWDERSNFFVAHLIILGLKFLI